MEPDQVAGACSQIWKRKNAAAEFHTIATQGMEVRIVWSDALPFGASNRLIDPCRLRDVPYHGRYVSPPVRSVKDFSITLPASS
jgi:hypothetical protein